jgi:glycerol-3-phosphate dehydrogenase
MRRRLGALEGEPFDLLVIGGGITGAGVALDATLRGLRVALIDKGDFASGTSSVSTKLAHGGLRYLEHGQLGLVYEALHERGRLLRNAPHLVRPLRFVIPFWSGARVPAWKWRAGLMLYDLLAGHGNLWHSRGSPAYRLRAEFPGLSPVELTGGAEYADAVMDDARLCIEVIHTAVHEGTVAANYVEAVGFDWPSRIVHVFDRLTGRELRIAARVVVNAAGPWVELVRRLAGEMDDGPLLAPTKGVHVLAPDRGLPAALLLLHPRDGRVFFVLPWMGKTLIGTTDTDCSSSPDELGVRKEEIGYLLEGHNHYLHPSLERTELLGSFAGLRPLLRSRQGEPSARSREFRVLAGPTGLITVAGGKYTTFRRMAEVIVDVVLDRLGAPSDRRYRKCRTRMFPLLGAPRGDWTGFAHSMVANLRLFPGLDEPSALHLVNRYGTRALEVARYVQNQPELSRPIVGGEPDVLAELAYQRDHEMAVLPADSFLRRTRLGLYRPEVLVPPPQKCEELRQYPSSAPFDLESQPSPDPRSLRPWSFTP